MAKAKTERKPKRYREDGPDYLLMAEAYRALFYGEREAFEVAKRELAKIGITIDYDWSRAK